MDLVAYWIYASLQSVFIVSVMGIKGLPSRWLALMFFTIAAPIATAMLVYIGMGYVISWLQSSPNQEE